ncbi:MAG: hypothetical protein ACI9OI_002431 [Chitinophagales bacterium]|jgi:hypothetical protein
MPSFKQTVGSVIGILLIALMVGYDSRPHFDQSLIQVKRDNGSAQRNWNLFYGQRFVYYDSSFRYHADLRSIKALIEPKQLILSDLATSYYAAAILPNYVPNVHRHHGRYQSFPWSEMLANRVACNLHQEGGLNDFRKFIARQTLQSQKYKRPKFSYVLINKDLNNRNVRLDCLWQRRIMLIENIDTLASMVFDGEYLQLYKLDRDLTPSTADSD